MSHRDLHTVKQALDAILERRGRQAAESDYDRGVWISAVAAARDAVEAIPVADHAQAYLGAVEDALDRLFNSYNDTSGDYTNGKAAIGDIRLDVARLSAGSE